MRKIGFIGLGNMGSGMALNQVKAGHTVYAFDLSEKALQQAEKNGCIPVNSIVEAVKTAEIIITMLPTGKHVYDVYEMGILPHANRDALLIDCSTIDIENAKKISDMSIQAGFHSADAPVSGGTMAAHSGTLTFMVGCNQDNFEAIEKALDPMSKVIFYAGDFGAGQAAKICNNMLLAITMIATCEAFTMAEKLGLDTQKFFDISSQASGQSWSMTSYCPVAGPVPTAPSNHNYKPGFSGLMLLKDLTIAIQTAQKINIQIPLGTHSAELYKTFCEKGGDTKDFSGIIEMLKQES